MKLFFPSPGQAKKLKYRRETYTLSKRFHKLCRDTEQDKVYTVFYSNIIQGHLKPEKLYSQFMPDTLSVHMYVHII